MQSYRAKIDESYKKGYKLGLSAVRSIMQNLMINEAVNPEEETTEDNNNKEAQPAVKKKGRGRPRKEVVLSYKNLPKGNWSYQLQALHDMMHNEKKRKFFKPYDYDENYASIENSGRVSGGAGGTTYNVFPPSFLKGVSASEYMDDDLEKDLIEIAHKQLKDKDTGSTIDINGETWGKVRWPRKWLQATHMDYSRDDKEYHRPFRQFTTVTTYESPTHPLAKYIIPTAIIKSSSHSAFCDLIVPFNLKIKYTREYGMSSYSLHTNNKQAIESSGLRLFDDIMNNKYYIKQMICFNIEMRIPEFKEEELWDYGRGKMWEAEQEYKRQIKPIIDGLLDMVDDAAKEGYSSESADSIVNYIERHPSVKTALNIYHNIYSDFKLHLSELPLK